MKIGKSSKDQDAIMANRHLDVAEHGTVKLLPKNLKEVMDTINRGGGSLGFHEYEVTRYGAIDNILNKYVGYLTTPSFLTNIKFTREQANLIEMRITAISTLIYGDILLAWTIGFLNDMIKHDSDLTVELLVRDGLVAFNTSGIAALRTLLEYKTSNSSNEGINDKESLFELDFQ